VSSASNPASPTCTHQRRPGTTVCLLCRQEARVAAAERRKKLFLRGTALAIVIAVVALVMSGVLSLRNRAERREAAAADSAATAHVASATAPAADSVVPQGQMPAAAKTVPPAPATSAIPAPTTAARGAAFAPTIRVGDTPLGGGAVATRGDSGVSVAFDTPELRTRIPEKFERYLRATLSQVYGSRIDPVLANIPLGKLAGQGDLLYELPVRGIRFPVEPGWHLEVFPEIRPGRDGPLVIRYRASVVKD
jgi:hypothetical protein